MPTSRQTLLAGVLRRIGAFSVASFHDRLRLQKTVYLLQIFGIYLGYHFGWYLYGPYSPALTRDAFETLPKFARFEPWRSADQETERRLGLFLRFLGDSKDDPQWLELVASLHMLNRMYGEDGRDIIFKKMKEKQPYLSEDQRIAGWKRLKEFGLV